MRILQITHQGDIGGSTNSISWLTGGLAARGHEVHLACRPESLIASRFREGPVRLVEARLPRGPRLVAEARRWRKWLVEHRIDVVNAHASLDRHLISYIRMMGTRTKIVHTRRNVALSSGGAFRARFDVGTTDAIIAVSARVAEGLLRKGMPESHVHVVRNGLPLADLPAPDPARVAALRETLGLRAGVPVIGVVARRKSQDELLHAVGRLGRPVEVLMAGVDRDEALQTAIDALPAGVRAQCLGFRDDVAELSALFDLFALPSTIEGFSLALLEAMARGLPCVATDAGGNQEALARDAGRLVRPGDLDGWVAALRDLLDDPARAAALGARGRQRAVGEFDVSRTIERTEALYAGLVAGGGA